MRKSFVFGLRLTAVALSVGAAAGMGGATAVSDVTDDVNLVRAGADGTAAFPITPFEVAAHFDPPAARWLAGHRGIDLVAQTGQSVVAPTRGIIHFAGIVAGRPVITVQTPNGDLLSMEPIASELRKGETVERGQVLGTVTAHANHCAGETCLHVGLRRAGNYIDPLILWPGYRPIIVLLPPLGD